MHEKFTDRARKVLQLANQIAQKFNCQAIHTEHILLGILQEGSGVAASVLKDFGIDLEAVQNETNKLIPPSQGDGTVTMDRLPYTIPASSVVSSAIEEARSLNHTHVGTEHILLGLIPRGVFSALHERLFWCIGEGCDDVLISAVGNVAAVLKGFEVEYDKVKERIVDVLKTSESITGGLDKQIEAAVHKLKKVMKSFGYVPLCCITSTDYTVSPGGRAFDFTIRGTIKLPDLSDDGDKPITVKEG